MKNNIIVSGQGPILLADTSCPVKETGSINGIFKDLRDAELATCIDKVMIASLADTKRGADFNGHQFSWPSLEEVRAIWDYKVIRKKLTGATAVTVEVTLVPPPRSTVKPKLYYRSIMSCCRAWDLTPTALHHIATKLPGWKDLCPPMMLSAKTDVRWPKDQGLQNGEAEEDLKFFSLSKQKSGIILRPRSKKPIHFDRIQDVPERLLAHSQWS